MKVLGISAMLSAVLFSLLGAAGKVYGFHSTPCIWLAFVNLPGFIIAVWIENWIGFSIAIILNSILYAGLFHLLRGIRSK